MKCKYCNSKHSMHDLAMISHTYFNFICYSCGAHYCGDKGKEKWFDNKSWDKMVNL